MIDSLPAGASCFIDANILGYALIELDPLTTRCRTFLERVALGDVLGFTSAGAVADALFRTMIVEASSRFVPAGTKPLTFLQNHPQLIAQLSHHATAAEALARLPLQLLPVDWDVIRAASRFSKQHGLLTNDATIVALMQRHQLIHLATNDDDFDRVPDLKAWKPR